METTSTTPKKRRVGKPAATPRVEPAAETMSAGGAEVIIVPSPTDTEDGTAGQARTASSPLEAMARSRGISPIASMFVVCFVIGTALAALGWIDSKPFHLIGFLGPIGAALLYPIWGYQAGVHREPSSRERFADNCYYLGFVFTQVALVFGFLPVAVFGKAIGSVDVLRFFGQALGASLVGLLARTLFVQSGHTVAENADIIEQEVEDLARAVSNKARIVLGEFSGMADTIRDASGRMVGEFELGVRQVTSLLAEYEVALRGHLDAFKTAGSAVQRSSADAVKVVATDLKAFEGAVVNAAGDIQTTAQALEARMAASARAIEAARETLSSEVTQASSAIQAAAASLARGVDALHTVSSLGDTVEALEGRLNTTSGRVEQMSAAVMRATGAAEAAAGDALRALNASSEHAHAEIRGLADRRMGEVQAAADRTFAETERRLGEISVHSDQMRANFADRAASINRDMEAAVHDLHRTLDAFRLELEKIRA